MASRPLARRKRRLAAQLSLGSVPARVRKVLAVADLLLAWTLAGRVSNLATVFTRHKHKIKYGLFAMKK
jgi:hypothetical protein